MPMNKVSRKNKQQADLTVRVRQYLDSVIRELKLVTWPGKEQVRATTLVVLLTVFIFAVYFGIVDFLLAWGQRLLYGSFI